MISSSEIWEKACSAARRKKCPECESAGVMHAADDSVLVCDDCGYSIDSDDYKDALFERIADEVGYYD